MTADRLRVLLDRIGWSQRELARRVGYDERQVRRWAAGATIPDDIAAWLEELDAVLARRPPPRRGQEAPRATSPG